MASEPPRSTTPTVRLPLEIRHGALTIILILAGLAALRLAAGLVVPLVLSGLAAVALEPLVRALHRLRVPRWLAAAFVVGGTVLIFGALGYELSDDAAEAARRLPEATEQLRAELRELRRGAEPSPLDAIAEAADDIEAAATEAAGGGQRQARPESSIALGLRDWVVVGSMSIIGFAGQLLLLIFLVYFLLASGDLFKRKLVRLGGPDMAGKRRMVDVIDEIHLSLERFIVVVVATNGVVAVVAWAGFWWLGLNNAALWGVFGGALNTIPYVGSAISTGVFFIVAFMQFDSLETAAVVAAVFLAITSLEGMWLKPWLMGRTARMNNVAVFVGLLFWGWLWGPWGMLLAFPIMMVIKTVADHVERMHPVAELLGE